jgi:hypothetical protein
MCLSQSRGSRTHSMRAFVELAATSSFSAFSLCSLSGASLSGSDEPRIYRTRRGQLLRDP